MHEVSAQVERGPVSAEQPWPSPRRAWYAVAIFGMVAIFYAPIALHEAFGGTPPAWPPLPMGLVPTVVLSLVVRGLINGEEIGWRGFALPQLQARHSALTASLIGFVVGAFFLTLAYHDMLYMLTSLALGLRQVTVNAAAIRQGEPPPPHELAVPAPMSTSSVPA